MSTTDVPAPDPAQEPIQAGGTADTTRERILRAALRLFAEHGYGATSMREIAEQLGITKAALYYHFDSKEDIVRALLADVEHHIAELTDWASGQPITPRLREEVLARWSDVMHAQGLALFRFIMANRSVVEGLKGDRDGMIQRIRALYVILTPPDATVEDKIRIRLALMSVNLAGMVGIDIDAPDEEILDAARRVALDLLPD